MRASEVSRDKIEDIRALLKEGDQIEAMIINIDRKNRNINLSITAKYQHEESSALQMVSTKTPASTGTTNLGALLKAKMDSKNSEEQ